MNTTQLDTAQYHALVEADILDKIELLDGRITFGRYDPVFSPEQVADAHKLGIRIRSAVDVLIEHPELRDELAQRLAAS